MSEASIPAFAVPRELAAASARGASEARATFASLGLSDTLLRAVRAAGYSDPTPIQLQAIPPALDGRDVVGAARTGTGKTAAYVLPMLERLAAHPESDADRGDTRFARALIVSPTRELAAQIGESIATYGRYTDLRHVVVYGGVAQERQVRELRRGVDIVVATPGRLCDLLEQRCVVLNRVELLVLDEFDRMLDQGFLPSIRRILTNLRPERQTLLFSATMPTSLESIVRGIVRNPVRVLVHQVASTPDRIEQGVVFVEPPHKRAALEGLLRRQEIGRAMVFTRTKHGANRLVQHLMSAGLDAEAIHGNKSQNARERTLARFRAGTLRVLVATDVAARGLDIDDVSHVFNYDLPLDPENYVHRIGRTARAGRAGAAVSLCAQDDRGMLARIERLIAQRLPELRNEASDRPEPVRSVQPPLRRPEASGHGRGRRRR